MNLQDYPDEIRDDIEDQSLDILEQIKDDVIVIGGWAVRALLGKKHKRYTLDVDAVASKDRFDAIIDKLREFDLKPSEADWGIKYHKKYVPEVYLSEELKSEIESIEIRIEISEPLIKEYETHHYKGWGYSNKKFGIPRSSKTVDFRVGQRCRFKNCGYSRRRHYYGYHFVCGYRAVYSKGS